MPTHTIQLSALDKAYLKDNKHLKQNQVFGPLLEEDVETFMKIKTFRSAVAKTWTIIPNFDETSFYEAKIIDGLHRHNTIQIFTQSQKTNACTCDDFTSNELGYCEHLAVITRLTEGFIRGVDATDGVVLTNRRLKSLALRMSVYCGKKIRIFFPKENKYVTFLGSDRPEQKVVDSVSCEKALKRVNYNDQFEERYNTFKSVSSVGLLDGINLYDYQEDIFQKMLAAKRCICSMIMGSGKTLTSIAVFEWLRQNVNKDFKMLVIAPKPLKAQWSSEIKKAIGLDSFQITDEESIRKYAASDLKVGVVTYQLIARKPELFKEMYHDAIILDEMQYVRNTDTKAWKAISLLKSEYMFGLSGTIIENRLDDLYAALSIIAPGFLGPQWRFNSHFQNITSFTPSVIRYQGVKNLEILRDRIKTLVFSYDKLELPKINHHQIFVTLNRTERAIHDDYYDQAIVLLSKSMKEELTYGEKMKLQSLLLKARQSTDTHQLISKQEGFVKSGKLTKIIELIQSFAVNGNEKIVIFSSWVQMLHIIGEHIKAFCPTVEFVYFTGQENEKKKAANLHKFQTDSKCRVFLASDSGGTGLDGLQLCSRIMIHMELPWNPAKIDQRNARLHRIKQTQDVIIYYLIGEESIETKMLETLYAKREMRQKVLYDEVEPETPIEQAKPMMVIEKALKPITFVKPMKVAETRKLTLRF